MQKYLYVVFLKTDTTMGKIVRAATNHEYNHVTLSFCPKLCKMFSFARYRKKSPLVGGFVCERPSRYLFPNRDAKTKICRLPISSEEETMLKRRISKFASQGKKMRYNSIGALTLPFGKNVSIKDTYTCLGFVCESLGICVDSIEELENILEKYVIYEGKLGKYVGKYDTAGLEYFDPIGISETVYDTACHFALLTKRLLD